MTVLAIAVATAGAAAADDEPVPVKARELADRGRALHAAGDYTAAITAFEEAYVLAPSPGLLFNLAQDYRLSGRCDDAAWLYRKYLASEPAPDRRHVAEVHLATVEKCGHGGLETQRPKTVPPQVAAAASLAATLVADPTPRGMTVTATKPVATDTPGLREKRYGAGLAIGGTIALAGAAWFALDAHDASDSVSALYAKGAKGPEVAAIDARGQRSEMVAEILGISGGLAVLSGATLYVLGSRSQTASERAVAARGQHIVVVPQARGAEVKVSWGF